jgi:hypothetical protein
MHKSSPLNRCSMKNKPIMLVWWLVTMTACVSTNNEETPDKYGFLARDDAGLLQRAHEPDIVEIILGCVYDLQITTILNRSN